MARLPQPGGDEGNWGSILNDFLSQSLSQDGTLKDSSVSESKLALNVRSKINSPPAIPDEYITNAKITSSTIEIEKLSASVQSSLSKADSALQLAPVESVAGKNGNVQLSKSDVGLSQVDNTSDAEKPVSTSQQAAIDLKADVDTVESKLNISDLDSQSAVNISNNNSATHGALRSVFPFPTWRPATGTWVQPRTGGIATTAATVGNFYFAPFFIPSSYDVSNLQIEITTASTSPSSVFAGIYPTEINTGMPDLANIIKDFGVISGTTVGARNFTFTRFTLPAGLLWFGFGCTGSSFAYRSQAGTMPWGLPWPSGTSPVAGTGGASGGAFSLLRSGLTNATSMPSSGGMTAVSAIAGPTFFFQVA